MPFLTNKCPNCDKIAVSEKEFKIGDSILYRLKCGHIIQDKRLVTNKSPEAIVSIDGKTLFPFQCNGVNFALDANVRVLIADEQRLGKTVQALGTLAMDSERLLPFLALVKTRTKLQWQRETMRWLGEDAIAQIIEGSNDHFLPQATGYIMSYDLARRLGDNFLDKVKELNIKTIILDECQQIKNSESQRTYRVRNLCREIPHVIALSGTPIKNNAQEYFSILNILRPTLFPRLSNFTYQWTQTYFDGYKYRSGGLANPDLFKSRTKDFIIRRERSEVKEEIKLRVDQVDRQYSYHELAKEVEDSYQHELEEFQDEYNKNNHSFETESNLLAIMAKLRRLTGISKIGPAVDFTEEFLMSTDRKLTIFVHHHDVADILNIQISGMLKEMGLDNALCFMPKDVEREFALDPTKRVAILSTLAHGEGSTIPTCSDCIVVERQWNPANEEQAESRFIHINQEADYITCTYLVAVGTIDEFFSSIVEQKREIVKKTLGGQAVSWSESGIMKELKDMLNNSGRRAWSLQ